MELTEAIFELIGRLAWPATVLVIVILFRQEFRSLVGRITKAKFPGGSVSIANVEQQVTDRLVSGRKRLTKRLESVVDSAVGRTHPESAKTIKALMRDDIKDTFETLQFETRAVAESPPPTPTEASPAAAPSPLRLSIHPGAPTIIRWLAGNESKYEFFSVKFLRQTIFANDHVAQDAIQFCIEKGLLELYKVPNPKLPAHPTNACRLNHKHEIVEEILRSSWGLDTAR